MPRSPSPSRDSRRRSRSPRRDRDRDYGRSDRDRARSRSRSPPRHAPRRAKELSFYKKSSSHRRDPLDNMLEETAKERMERRDRGEVPARFGGTREHGVRNTMSTVAPSGTAPTGMGSLKRSVDPLERMPVKGGGGDEYRREDRGRGDGYDRSDSHRRDRRDGDKAREERVSAMDKASKQPVAVPTAAPS